MGVHFAVCVFNQGLTRDAASSHRVGLQTGTALQEPKSPALMRASAALIWFSSCNSRSSSATDKSRNASDCAQSPCARSRFSAAASARLTSPPRCWRNWASKSVRMVCSCWVYWGNSSGVIEWSPSDGVIMKQVSRNGVDSSQQGSVQVLRTSGGQLWHALASTGGMQATPTREASI
jgi:hypothetical protein